MIRAVPSPKRLLMQLLSFAEVSFWYMLSLVQIQHSSLMSFDTMMETPDNTLLVGPILWDKMSRDLLINKSNSRRFVVRTVSTPLQ